MEETNDNTNLQGVNTPVVSTSVSVPSVRVRFYPMDMDETFDGTVLDERNGCYIVAPDDDLNRTERWHKSRCDVLR